MALTRPKLSQFDTNIASTSDPITVLNAGSTSANVDVGFLVNRANGLLSNVALYWNEASGAITTAFTANTGSTNSNIAISGYAPISTGNISSISTAVASSTYTTANVSGYQLGMYVNAGLGSIVLGFGTNTSPGTFMTLSASGGKNYIATAYRDFYISDGAGAQPFYITQANGNVTLNSSSSSTSTTTGALVVKGGTGIAGNVHSGGYHYITPTSVTDLAGGSYSSAIIVPGNSWGIYSNVATAGTAYLRQVLGKDSGNNIVVGHSSGTGLVANVNVYAGTSSNSSFNVINGLSNLPMLTVNTTANTVVIANSQSSVSTTTGALQVAGGTGIAGNLYVGGNITVPGVSGQVIFYNSTQHLSSVNSFGELSPLFGGLLSRPLNFVSNTATMRIARPVGTGDPAVELIAFDYGTSAQSTWWDFFAGGDQFNIRRRTNGGANIALTATQYTTYFPTTNVVIQTSTASTSTSSGALQVAGGAGVAGALYAGSVYDTGTRVLSTSSGAGNLSISGTAVTLPLTGPGATTVGSGTAIPVITTDAYGRVVALSTSSVSTTINTAGTTGTGSVSGGGTLTFSSTNGVVVSASGSTIGIATPQDLRSTATPTFTGVTTNGNTIINSTAYINGITSITNNTNSTGAGNGALVVTGGIGASGTVNFGSDLYVSGNIYTANLVATTTSTLNTASPMAYFQVSPSYPYNFETGIYSHFIGGPANVYAHTGFVRNHNNNYWTFFSNVKSEPTSTTINFADTGIIYDTIYAGGAIIANATPSTNTTTGALVVTGGAGVSGNLNVNNAGYFGYNAAATSLVNPSIIGTSSSQAVNAGQYYVQMALINNAGTGSSDITAYPNNVTDGSSGFMDMGVTGNLFADPSYTITKANDGYLFASAKDGAALGGNLVLATDKTGTYNDIVVAVGSFYSNAEVARFHGNTTNGGYLQLSQTTTSTSTTSGALRVSGGIGITGNVYSDKLYVTNGIYWAGNNNVISSGGGGSAPAGATGQVQFNSGGVLGASPLYYWSGNTSFTTSVAITSISSITASSLTSTVATGTAPFTVSSTTAVTNLNADLWDGNHFSDYLNQGVKSTSAPTFAGGSFTANVTRNSKPIITNYTGNTAPASPIQGDEWWYSAGNQLYKYIYDGTNSQWVNFSSALYNASTSATASTLALRDTGGNLTATNFLGVASSAKYADLAEIYASDAEYEPGTVVVFGGEQEITVTSQSHDTRVAGVISTNPAYLMNSEAVGLPVAFTGRVPCKVQGPVTKGDVLVTSPIMGVAQRIGTDYQPGCILGKALEDNETSNISTIEVVVGRF